MKLDNMLPYRRFGIAAALLMMTTTAAADDLTQSYCSTANTGSDYSAVTSIYQSNGLCHDQCNGDGYAFAVVQYQQCWCSNYAPADTTSVSDCDQNCPGYPSESCGNSDTGLYGYIALDASPSGTAGSSSSVASSTSSTEQTSTKATSTSVVVPTTTTSTKTSTTATSSTPAMAVTSVIMTTISGAVVTQTVTSTPIIAPASHSDTMPLHRKNGLGAGAIAGIVIGVLAGLALLALGAFLLWRRKRAQGGEESGAAGSGGKKILGRNVSVLSKAGLLARNDTGPSMGEREHDDGYYASATGPNSTRHSMMFAPGAADGISPVSPLGSSDGSQHSRRLSKPLVYDQRLNPSALFANAEANGSRISMQDQQDYSRPLGIANPDPRPSFESRISHT